MSHFPPAFLAELLSVVVKAPGSQPLHLYPAPLPVKSSCTCDPLAFDHGVPSV